MTPTLDPSVRGHQPAGHKRWERAAQWAKAHPDHKNAKTYLARKAAADEVATWNGQKPWLMFRKGRAWAGEPDWAYQYQCCSTTCAVLQLQLEMGVAGLESLHARVLDTGKQEWRMEERPADSKRRGKCKGCGATVGA